MKNNVNILIIKDKKPIGSYLLDGLNNSDILINIVKLLPAISYHKSINDVKEKISETISPIKFKTLEEDIELNKDYEEYRVTINLDKEYIDLSDLFQLNLYCYTPDYNDINFYFTSNIEYHINFSLKEAKECLYELCDIIDNEFEGLYEESSGTSYVFN